MMIDKFDKMRETHVDSKGYGVVEYKNFVKKIFAFIVQDVEDDLCFYNNLRFGVMRPYFMLLESFVCGRWDSTMDSVAKFETDKLKLFAKSNMSLLEQSNQICVEVKEFLKANIKNSEQFINTIDSLLYMLGSSTVRELPKDFSVNDVKPVVLVLDILLAFPCDYFVQLYVDLEMGQHFDLKSCCLKELTEFERKIALLHYYLYAPVSVTTIETDA